MIKIELLLVKSYLKSTSIGLNSVLEHLLIEAVDIGSKTINIYIWIVALDGILHHLDSWFIDIQSDAFTLFIFIGGLANEDSSWLSHAHRQKWHLNSFLDSLGMISNDSIKRLGGITVENFDLVIDRDTSTLPQSLDLVGHFSGGTHLPEVFIKSGF